MSDAITLRGTRSNPVFTLCREVVSEMQARFSTQGMGSMMEAYLDSVLAEISRIEAEHIGVVIEELPHGALKALRQVHDKGLHGRTIEQTAAMILAGAMLSFLPEKFEWCDAAQDGKVRMQR